ncbi:unnamed protein product [Amoebophrya sp. A120]|nr:unnamed protein product [Amoebophrya sp. A120]|eukprot:GSA120T00021985001.1
MLSRPRKFLIFAAFWTWLTRAEDGDDAKEVDDELDDDDDKEFAKEVEADSPKEEVVALTEATFQDFVKKNERVVVEFYAPWCGHCKQLAPEYEKAAKGLKAKKAKTKLAKVDATVESKLAESHSVSGYPTLVYYVNGEHSEYTGPRDDSGIQKWVMARERDLVMECDDEKITTEIANKEGVKFILVASNLASKKSGKAVAVKKAMQKLQGMDKQDNFLACYHSLLPSSDPEESAKKEDEKMATLKVIRKNAGRPDDKELKFDGGKKNKWAAGKISDWLLKQAVWPLIGQDTRDGWYSDAKLFETAGVKEVLSLQIEDSGVDDPLMQKLVKLASDKKYSKTMKVAVNSLMTDPKPEAKFVLMNYKNGAKPLKYLHDADDVDKFVKDYFDGKLKPSYKSADVPKDPYDKDVRVLVGKDFERVALDPKKDVFVEFYAPWCGHCKNLAPEWEALARKVRKFDPKGDKVIVAKMDATENESMEEVTGFPTLVLYPAVKNSFKKKIAFSGAARKEADLLEFLQEGAVNIGDEVDLSSGKSVDKSKFNMVERERARKKKGGKKEEL